VVTLRRLVSIALAAGLLAGVPPALGDGDPASDTLYSGDVYFPYSPKVAPTLQRTMVRVLKTARRHHHPFKVALIQTPADLGAYPSYFGRPERYAKLLFAELSSYGRKKIHLLVVMPSGFGAWNLGEHWRRQVRHIQVHAQHKSNGLADAAIQAVRLLYARDRRRA
jgi:hypothetical protein